MISRDAFISMLARHLRKWVCWFVVTVLIVAALRSAVVDWSDVPSRSMAPTILPGDCIFVNKIAYDLRVPFTGRRLSTWADPKRGDVVVFFSPRDGTPLVKRIAAGPSDRVDGVGQALPAGKFYVLGDNPAQSTDSRDFGLVDRRQILGKAVAVVVSFDPNHDPLPRWSRFFARLP